MKDLMCMSRFLYRVFLLGGKVSFYVQRQKVNFSTKVSVEEKNWNDKKKRVSSSDL